MPWKGPVGEMAAHCVILGSMWGWMAIRYHIDGGNPTLKPTTGIAKKMLAQQEVMTRHRGGAAEKQYGKGKPLSATGCPPLTIMSRR